MQQELRNKWIEALRSGKYKQGKYCLRTKDNEFCCLGVLADVIDPTKWKTENKHRYYLHEGVRRQSSLAPNLLKKIKLRDYSMHRLVVLNDEENKTFEEIADWIETTEV